MRSYDPESRTTRLYPSRSTTDKYYSRLHGSAAAIALAQQIKAWKIRDDLHYPKRWSLTLRIERMNFDSLSYRLIPASRRIKGRNCVGQRIGKLISEDGTVIIRSVARWRAREVQGPIVVD